jgi:hypothetical protein
MAFQARIAPALVVIEPDLPFLVFEATLHAPARGPDQQQRPDGGARRGRGSWRCAARVAGFYAHDGNRRSPRPHESYGRLDALC